MDGSLGSTGEGWNQERPLSKVRFKCMCWGAPHKWAGVCFFCPHGLPRRGAVPKAAAMASVLMGLSLLQALFALSSLLRHFPYAQQQFLKLGGLQVLRSLFRQKGMETLHVRVVTLLYDLIVEKVRSRRGGDGTWAGTPLLHPLTAPEGLEYPRRTRARRG